MHAQAARDKARGEVASALDPSCGCHFHPRRPTKQNRCVVDSPGLLPVGDGHTAACHFADRPTARAA